MGRIGPGEIALLAFLALLLFGATRIADIGKGLGEGIRNFKKGLKEGDEGETPKLTEGAEKSTTEARTSEKVAEKT